MTSHPTKEAAANEGGLNRCVGGQSRVPRQAELSQPGLSLSDAVGSTAPINRLIDSIVKCVKCGAGKGECDCWTKCSCGWEYERGGSCRNPVHRKTTKKGRRIC